MDFYRIKERPGRNGVTEVYPDFKVTRSKDLMVQGKSFYAIWDEEAGLWSTDEYDVQRLVDADLMKYKDELGKKSEGIIQAKLLLVESFHESADEDNSVVNTQGHG